VKDFETSKPDLDNYLQNWMRYFGNADLMDYKMLLLYSTVQKPPPGNDTHHEPYGTSSTAMIPTSLISNILLAVMSNRPQSYYRPEISMRAPQPVVNVECRSMSLGKTMDTGIPYILDNDSEGVSFSLRELIGRVWNNTYSKNESSNIAPPLWISFPELGSSTVLGIFLEFLVDT
jgi:hypothetical protein